MNKYGIIMAGGSGSRFWPLSRKDRPKQLLNLTGKDFMVNEAIERLHYTVDMSNIYIVTSATQKPLVAKVTRDKLKERSFIVEPAARSTAPCIGLAAVKILKQQGDGIMIITPSDAYIKDNTAFTRTVSYAVSAADKQDKLVTIGIAPTYPATGYGYIKFNKNEPEKAKHVLEFKEKPEKEIAEQYIKDGNYVWNSGMFVWRASTILEKYKEFAPDIYSDLLKIYDAIGTPEEDAVINEVYPQIRAISVDFAIMEPAAAAGDVSVVYGDFGWNDIGTWDTFDVLYDEDENGNIVVGDSIIVDSKDNVIYGKKRVIATVGVENLVIVDTDDALLICKKDEAQKVKTVVESLEKAGRKDLI